MFLYTGVHMTDLDRKLLGDALVDHDRPLGSLIDAANPSSFECRLCQTPIITGERLDCRNEASGKCPVSRSAFFSI